MVCGIPSARASEAQRNKTMIRSAVTISLVLELKGGPFVFSGDLERHCAKAAELGFDAVELFVRDARALAVAHLETILKENGLKVSGFGTGPGWVVHKLRLTDPDAGVRRKAIQFVGDMIDFAGHFGAPAIVGSMQGRVEPGVARDQTLDWLREALEEVAPRAASAGVPILLEPLNRYESNVVCSIDDGLAFLAPMKSNDVRLLCDLFHMNIEEADMAASLRRAGRSVGHVHFADSNRLAVGFGHTDLVPIVQALSEIGYDGYISAEAVPLPDPETAAAQSIHSFKRFFRT